MDVGGPGDATPPRGLSPFGSFARAGDLGPNDDSPLVGTWQVAFLGEIEPRAARPGMSNRPAASAESPRGIINRAVLIDPQNAEFVSCSAQTLADLHANRKGCKPNLAIQNADGDPGAIAEAYFTVEDGLVVLRDAEIST